MESVSSRAICVALALLASIGCKSAGANAAGVSVKLYTRTNTSDGWLGYVVVTVHGHDTGTYDVDFAWSQDLDNPTSTLPHKDSFPVPAGVETNLPYVLTYRPGTTGGFVSAKPAGAHAQEASSVQFTRPYP